LKDFVVFWGLLKIFFFSGDVAKSLLIGSAVVVVDGVVVGGVVVTISDVPIVTEVSSILLLGVR